MDDEPAHIIFLDQQEVSGDHADGGFVTLPNSSVNLDIEISGAKQLLQSVALDLNDIKNTLQEAVEQNVTPLKSTCDAVNKAHEDVEKVIVLLKNIEHKSKCQEIAIINLNTRIYGLNNEIEAHKQDIKKLQEANRRLEKKVDHLEVEIDALKKNQLGFQAQLQLYCKKLSQTGHQETTRDKSQAGKES